MKNIYLNIYRPNFINFKKAKKNIENNNVIGLPTETVYGLAANAYSDKSVKKIFKLKKIPFRQVNFYEKNEEELGKIFTFFVLETILLSRLMKVDPFNQPAVEQVKIETKKFLTQKVSKNYF